MSRHDVDVDTLAAAIAEGSPPRLIDTRSRREFEAGHIPGAVRVPFWKVGSRHEDLDADADEHIVVYCQHGPRAVLARKLLARRGYRRVGLLRGHYHAWKKRQRGA